MNYKHELKSYTMAKLRHLHGRRLEAVLAQPLRLALLALGAVGGAALRARLGGCRLSIRLGRQRLQALQVAPLRLERRARRQRRLPTNAI